MNAVRAAALAVAGAVSFGMAIAAPPALDPARFPPIDEVIGNERYWNIVREGADADGLGDYEELLPLIPAPKNTGSRWKIYKTRWDEADERGYEAFVSAIGRSGCISIDDCLRSPANPYRDLEDETLWLGDCTDMVYVLRGYYAWKNGLPFSYQSSVGIRRGDGDPGNDLRYSKFGNFVAERSDVLHRAGRSAPDAPMLLTRLFNIVSTAMLRVHPEDEERPLADFYPVEISREALRPGAIAYDIYGHVSIVYDITRDGRIHLISSHPDYTVTRELYGAHVVRSHPNLGGGLKAWRPIELVGATRQSDGSYVGGRIVPVSNEDAPGFSMEQYFGTHPDEAGWENATFVERGRTLPYYKFVRERLRHPDVPFDPVDEVAEATYDLCRTLKARKTAVNLAVYAKMPTQPHPDRLPENIYGTYGDWERYATPSRDARIKMQAVELRAMVDDLVSRHAGGEEMQGFKGQDLAAALLDVYDRGAEACRLNYRRSDGSVVKLNLHHAMDRMFELSFDPFHCPERRWGATGKELETCTDDEEKTRWYEAQRWLRNDPERTYDERHAFAVDELKDPATASPEEGGVGRSDTPDVNVLGYLEDHAGAHVTASEELPQTILREADATN